MKGVVGDLAALVASLENLAIAAADAGALKGATEAIQAMTNGIRTIASYSPDALKFGAYATAGLAVIGPLGMALGGLVSLFKLAILPIRGLAAAVSLLTAAAGAKGIADGVAGDAAAGAAGAAAGKGGKLLKAMKLGGKLFLPVAAGAALLEYHNSKFPGAWQTHKMGSDNDALKQLKADLAAVDAEIQRIRDTSKIPDMADTLVAPLTAKRQLIMQELQGLEAEMAAKGSAAGTALGQSMADGTAAQLPGLIGQVNSIIAQMQAAANKGVTIPMRTRQGTAMPSVFNQSSGGHPGIDGARARGGSVRMGRTYLVGEKGPEPVTFGRSGRVGTNRQLSELAGAGGGGGVHIGAIHIQSTDPKGAADELERKLTAMLTRTRQLSLEGRPVTT